MLYVVVPAYNEAENLREVLPHIREQVKALDPDGCVLVVNDGSRDGSDSILSAMTAADLQVLTFRRNRGKAAALKSGFERALDEGATEIVMMDADGQDDPAELTKLLERLRDGADLVTGARLERNDRLIKRQTSRLYNRVTGLLSGAPGRDFNSGFKAMRAEVAREVSPMLYGELHRYLTVMSFWMGYSVVEVPVHHHARLHGTTKYGLARFWRGFVDLLTVRFLMSYESRPSHLFSGVGVTSLALGSGALGYLFVLKLTGHNLGDRPLLIAGVLMALVGLQLILFGLLAELIVYVRNSPARKQD